jgi:hypothetical protein
MPFAACFDRCFGPSIALRPVKRADEGNQQERFHKPRYCTDNTSSILLVATMLFNTAQRTRVKTASLMPDKQKMMGQANEQVGIRAEQPDLVASSTDDSDDVREVLSKENTDITTNGHTEEANNHREAVAYLLRYETMVLQQEAEEIATLAYIRPLLERLQWLGRNKGQRNTLTEPSPAPPADEGVTYTDLYKREITYGELNRALQVLEDECSSSTKKLSSSETIITKDRQLVMILKMLTQKHSIFNRNGNENDDLSITWAEVVHCYRVCIIGMLTLRNLPKGSLVRSRAKDRILSQLSLFESPATKLLDENVVPLNSDALDADLLFDGQEPTSNDCQAKKQESPRALVLVALFCVVLILGFVVGVVFQQPGDGWLGLFQPLKDSPALELGRFPLQKEKTPDDSSDHRKNNRLAALTTFLPARETLPTTIPQRLQEYYDIQKLSPATLLHMATMTNKTGTQVADVPEQQQSSTQHKAPESVFTTTNRHQLVASAVAGAAAGVLGAPKILALGKTTASALSLGSIGIVPTSLVVVGAVAVTSAVFRGFLFVFRRSFAHTDERQS